MKRIIFGLFLFIGFSYADEDNYFENEVKRSIGNIASAEAILRSVEKGLWFREAEYIYLNEAIKRLDIARKRLNRQLPKRWKVKK